MSETQIWGNKPRAVNDPTLVDEAIEQAVLSHCDDPDAHLDAGQSLTTHRAAEIIDHVAESVVNDKLKANARTYVAIVDNNSLADYDNIEDALDYACSLNGGSVFVKRGNYTPARQLKFRYGVDLYGEGPGETVINRTVGVFDYLSFDGTAPLSVADVTEAAVTIDSDQVAVLLPVGLTAYDMIGMYFDWSIGQDFFFDAIDNNTVILPFVAASDENYVNAIVHPVVNCTDASDIVTITGYKFISGLENGDGLQLWAGGWYIGDIDTYLGAGEFQLTANAQLDGYQLQDVEFRAEGARMSKIEGVTLDCASAGAAFHDSSSTGRVAVRDCAIINVKELATGNLSKVEISDTQISYVAGVCDFNTRGANIRNCQVYFTGTTDITTFGGAGSFIENTKFYTGYLEYADAMSNVPMNTMFNGCQFENVANGNIVNSGSYYGGTPNDNVMFTGCKFFNSGTRSVIFKGNNISVVANRIFIYGGGTTGLDSTSRYCIFTGNQGKGTLTTQPINCLLANNMFVTSMS